MTSKSGMSTTATEVGSMAVTKYDKGFFCLVIPKLCVQKYV